VTGWLFSQETIRTAVHDEPALLRGIRHDLRLNLASEARVLLDQNELDIVALGRGPRDFVGCTKSCNAAANNDDPFHTISYLKNNSS